jgi:hypothetical protein
MRLALIAKVRCQMHAGFSKYVPLLLFPAIGVFASCGDRDHANPTAPTVLTSASVTAEPSTARPELVPNRLCVGGSSFGVRIVITIGAGSDITASRLRFEFTDRAGHRTVPLALATASATSESASKSVLPPIPIPTQSSIPIPGSSPVTIPSSSPIPVDGMQIPAGSSRTVSIFLQFGCGVAAPGTLIVSVDTTDMRGTSFTPQVRVRVDG